MITYCSMTMNRLHETKLCVERYLPYVDKVVIVDGGSEDDTIFYMRNLSKDNPKVEFYLCPWKDNFSEQRNNYLKHVPDNTWALVSDPDEIFDDLTLRNLPLLIETAEKMGKDMVGFQCRSVSLSGERRTWQNLDNYWKRLLFKKYSATRYVGNPHEALAGHPQQILDTKFTYEHRKQENVIWHRGARNMFVGGGGPNLGEKNPRWVHLRDLCKKLGIANWHDLDKYLMKGHIDPSIKDWMVSVHDLDGFDGASEHRELYKLYFRIYHPEEELLELKDKYIP